MKEPKEHRDISYGIVKRWEYELIDVSIDAAKKFLKEMKEKHDLNAVCCNIWQGRDKILIDYAPFGDWARADENVNHDFSIYNKKTGMI